MTICSEALETAALAAARQQWRAAPQWLIRFRASLIKGDVQAGVHATLREAAEALDAELRATRQRLTRIRDALRAEFGPGKFRIRRGIVQVYGPHPDAAHIRGWWLYAADIDDAELRLGITADAEGMEA